MKILLRKGPIGGLLLSLFLILLVSNCSEPEVSDQSSERFVTLDLIDEDILNSLQTNVNSQGRLESNELDWAASKVIKDQETSSETYAIPFTGNRNQYASFQLLEGEIISSHIVEISDRVGDTQDISYFHSDGSLIGTLSFNYSKNIVYLSNTTSRNARSGDCGPHTMECILFWYEENGWGSVLLFVATAIDPLVGVAVAGACAVHECILP